MSGHCFAHGRFDGLHCPECYGFKRPDPSIESDRKYQTERAGILATGVGLARLYLDQGNPEAAKEALDTAAMETRALLERLLPFFNTDEMTLPEETPTDV